MVALEISTKRGPSNHRPGNASVDPGSDALWSTVVLVENLPQYQIRHGPVRLKTRRKKSEVHPDPKFHGARESSFCRKLPKRLWVLPGYVEVGIQQLVVVQNIDEIDRGLDTEALCHSDVLLDAEVHVPVGQPSELAEAAAIAVKTQNQRANMAKYGLGIREHDGDSIEHVERGACPNPGGQDAVGVL